MQKFSLSFWGPFWDYSKTDFTFLHRPAHAVKHSSVWGQRRLRLCPETSGAVGPKLSDVSAVLSDGEGCGKNESRCLLPCCESHGGPTPSSTPFWSVVTLFPLFICCFMLYLLFLKRVQRFLFFINITAMVSCDGFGQGRGAEVSLVSFIGTWPLSAYSLPADHPLDFLSIVVHLHLRWCSLTYTGCRRGRDCSFFLAGHRDLPLAFLTWIIVTF